jgi:restriction system protein
MKKTETLAKSKQTAAKTLHEALSILKAAGGSMPGKEVIARMRQNLKFTDWEQEIYEKTGYVRWESIFAFYTIDLMKAGYLRKNKRIWHITEEGEKALKKGPIELMQAASDAYRKWHKNNQIAKEGKDEHAIPEEDQGEDLSNDNQLQKATIDQLETQAIEGLKEHIIRKNAYEFQDMVAALLRAMGYYTPFISPKGRDGGLDVVVYRDPLGASEPRIKVQVKHKPDSSVPVNDIRSLVGLLNKSGDIGLFVTSGWFTNDSEKFARDSHIHVRLIDIDAFIGLWEQFYEKLTDEEKNWLPLHRISFLGTNE